MSHWQKVKLAHKEGTKKQEIQEYFGIKTIQHIVQRKSKPAEKPKKRSK